MDFNYMQPLQTLFLCKFYFVTSFNEVFCDMKLKYLYLLKLLCEHKCGLQLT